MSVYAWNEIVLAISALVWGSWVMGMVVTLPYSPTRLFFALVMLVPGLILSLVQLPAIRRHLDTMTWGGFPASVRSRQVLHFWLAWAWMMVAVAITLGDATRPIHSVPYVALGLICAGKVLRLAHYDR